MLGGHCLHHRAGPLSTPARQRSKSSCLLHSNKLPSASLFHEILNGQSGQSRQCDSRSRLHRWLQIKSQASGICARAQCARCHRADFGQDLPVERGDARKGGTCERQLIGSASAISHLCRQEQIQSGSRFAHMRPRRAERALKESLSPHITLVGGVRVRPVVVLGQTTMAFHERVTH